MADPMRRAVEADVVVVGTGVAGLTAALELRPLRVHVLTKSALASGASPWAQGGIAAAVSRDDSPALHAADTLAVAGGVGDVHIVARLTQDGPAAVRRVVERGALLDAGPEGYALGREAAHSRARILHARDKTGAELVRALGVAVRAAAHVTLFEGRFASELWLEHGRVAGVWSHDERGAMLHRARAVVLATGGIGQVYERTTNPSEATGDGLAMAARAGALLADLEFVQFHPTALAAGADPMPLLSEALRGEGASIVDQHGRRFLFDTDERGELAPRDVVARAIATRLLTNDTVYLDARTAIGAAFPERFPTVFELCARHGFDPRTQPIPVSPAAHYHMGGIAVDATGATSVPGLWACGEVACTGAHGANRLASNSLLEALVFGETVARAVHARGSSRPLAPSRATLRPPLYSLPDRSDAALRSKLRAEMWRQVGLCRDEEGLHRALATFGSLAVELPPGTSEVRNLLTVARLVTLSALERRESRGAHARLDYPDPDPHWQRRHYLQPERPATTIPSRALRALAEAR